MAEEAREHKRLSELHRRRARRAQRQLVEFCQHHGIELRLVKLTQSEEGQSHATDPQRVA